MGLLERILKETTKQLDKATKRMNEAIAEQERLAKEAMSRAIAEQERLAKEAESTSTNHHFKEGQHAPMQQVPMITGEPCPLTTAENKRLSDMRIQMMKNQIRRAEEGAMRVGVIGTDYRLVYKNNDDNSPSNIIGC
ncbi:hypothetical protein RND81_05G138400 [Saponaria officinalis]|uniref:Uncharacterized protein n=1 Tax=Saponaria officinalis TaxID=3572 RepID=A0AAW1KXV9_SAPOF